MNPKLLIWLSSAGMLFAVLFGAYSYGRHVEFLKQDKLHKEAIIKQQVKTEDERRKFIEQLTEAVNENAKHKAVIRDLAAKSGRVRIEFPTCPMSATSETAAHPDTGTRVLPESVDALFGELQERVTGLIEACDTLNAEAIRNNSLN